MAESAERCGRFLMIQDVNGTMYAIAPKSLLIAAATKDGGTIALLAGGRAVCFAENVRTIATWFSGTLE